VKVHTDLNITGKVAQFGRGALGDISEKLIDQFAVNLETMVLSEQTGATSAAAAVPTETAAAAPVVEAVADTTDTTDTTITAAATAASEPVTTSASAAAAAPTVRKIEQAEVAPLNVGSVARGAILKRLAPVGVVIAGIIVWLISRGGN
jgi:uncharacterized protein